MTDECSAGNIDAGIGFGVGLDRNGGREGSPVVEIILDVDEYDNDNAGPSAGVETKADFEVAARSRVAPVTEV